MWELPWHLGNISLTFTFGLLNTNLCIWTSFIYIYISQSRPDIMSGRWFILQLLGWTPATQRSRSQCTTPAWENMADEELAKSLNASDPQPVSIVEDKGCRSYSHALNPMHLLDRQTEQQPQGEPQSCSLCLYGEKVPQNVTQCILLQCNRMLFSQKNHRTRSQVQKAGLWGQQSCWWGTSERSGSSSRKLQPQPPGSSTTTRRPPRRPGSAVEVEPQTVVCRSAALWWQSSRGRYRK